MVNTRYSELIAQYLANDIGVKNRKDLMEWVQESPSNKAYFEEMVEIWTLSDQYEDDTAFDTSAAWDKLDSKLPQVLAQTTIEKGGGKIIRFRKKQWAVAATIALILSVGGYWFSNNYIGSTDLIVLETGLNEQLEQRLPDGSRIILNENSSISYEKDFEERLVSLKGEAFFDITKQNGATFKIVSGNTTTTVLGTSFNVRAYPDESKVEVTVESGVVELQESSEAQDKVQLKAGDTGFYDVNLKQTGISKELDDNAHAWRTKALVFNDIKVEAILHAMERYFNIEVEVENDQILNCKWSADYQNPNLQNIWDAFAYALDLEVQTEEQNKKYRVTGVGCGD